MNYERNLLLNIREIKADKVEPGPDIGNECGRKATKTI